MTFVTLPSLTDVMSQTTGASAWAKPAFDQFLPAMLYATALMSAAIILFWIGSRFPMMASWLNTHFFNSQTKSDLSMKEKRAIFGDMQEMIDEDNLQRKINRLGFLSGDFKQYRHNRGYKS